MSRTPARITQADVARISNAETFIYFLRAGEFVKIGQSMRWKERKAHMQIGSPYTIVPLLILAGDRGLEKKLHARFRADHFRGEWFHMSPTIGDFVKKNRSNCVSESEIFDLRKPLREIIL